ncbi:MAG: tetratricopeptide repeat protein [Lentisphaeraceae bacterium]|nr:tetratricopeptide repeat protein [Lentisphaeraceae bacterium]
MSLSSQEQLEYEACRKSLAFTEIHDWALLRLKGDDHLQFLQGQTTNDVLSLNEGEGQASAILTPKAKLVSLIMNFRCKDSLYMLVPTVRQEVVKEHLEKYAIMDEVEISLPDFKILSIVGPESRSFLEEKFDQTLTMSTPYSHQQLDWKSEGVPLLNYSFTGENGYLTFSKDTSSFLSKIDPQNELVKLSENTQEALRVEAGIPKWGVDCDENTLFPEMNLQTSSVSYTKGCFVGQEIVARVKYRGAVNKILMGLVFDEATPVEVGDFSVRGQKGGVLKSLAYSPNLGKFIALAYVNKQYRSPGTRFNLEIAGQSYKASSSLLPFYQCKSDVEEAEDLYFEAMDLFKSSSEEEDIKAEPLLKKAIQKDPKLADAYETLGVILSRHERYDEAIAIMKQLKEINPEQVMAYSNLSLYYMKKGMIEEAEDEKAAATAVTFKIAAKERKERIEFEKYEEEKRAEAERRLGMFKQVLEIDPEDLIANFGLGKALLDSGKYEDAIPYLQKCLDVKKDYTVAYLNLGLAYMKSGNQAQAAEIFKNGIDCARISGDMMPGNEMESHLAKLKISPE